jgi:hypothetical protein
MTINANTVWEVRTAGSDTNGGGFVAGAAGTDYSQQDAPNTVGSNISTTDVVATGTSTISSATAAFTTAIAGNTIYLSGGTGSLTAQRYTVNSRSSATAIVVDRIVAAGTGITMNVGGALASINAAYASMVTNNAIWVKNDGTYTQTATPATTGNMVVYITGYTTTRGDGGRPTIELSTNTGLTAIPKGGTSSVHAANFIIDCKELGTSSGIVTSAGAITNCTVKNFTSIGITLENYAATHNCEVTGGTSTATGGIATIGASNVVTNCYVHDNACSGVVLSTSSLVARCLIINCTGASSNGVSVTGGTSATNVINSTIYGCGQHGISVTSSLGSSWTMINNILANNGGYGISFSGTAIRNNPLRDGNVFYANTSGTRLGLDSTSTTWGVSPYVDQYDVILTATPFVDAANGDFRLNQSAAGASCRNAALPRTWLGTTKSPNFLDYGACDHLDPGCAF